MNLMQAPHVQKQLLEQNVVGSLLQEISQMAEVQPTGYREHLQSEGSASRLAGALHIPGRIAGSKPSIKRTSTASQQQINDSPHIPALFPSAALAAIRTGGGAVEARDHKGLTGATGAAPTSQGMFGDLKVPPGFVSSGDLEEDLDRLMELESQVCHPANLYICAVTQVEEAGIVDSSCSQGAV